LVGWGRWTIPAMDSGASWSTGTTVISDDSRSNVSSKVCPSKQLDGYCSGCRVGADIRSNHVLVTTNLWDENSKYNGWVERLRLGTGKGVHHVQVGSGINIQVNIWCAHPNRSSSVGVCHVKARSGVNIQVNIWCAHANIRSAHSHSRSAHTHSRGTTGSSTTSVDTDVGT